MKWKKRKEMERMLIKEITYNLDSRRVPLNSKQRSLKESNPIYPYIGANHVMGYIDEYIFDEKILCIAEDGGSWGKNETCAKIYNEKVWVNNHAHVLTAKNNLHLEYLMYYLNWADLSLFINGATRGKLTQAALNSIQIPLPPLPVQKAIAARLDKAQDIIRINRELIDKYEQLTQSLFLDMFGDPVNNEMGWERVKLKNVCIKITDGTHHSPEPQTEGFPYVTAKHVKADGLDFNSKPTFVSREAHDEIYNRCSPEFGDVLYIKDGATTGIACINVFREPISLLSSLALLKVDVNKINNRYLCYWLNNPKNKQKYINEFMAGAAIKRYTLSKINSFELNLPPIALQNKFATRVQAIESQKQLAQESLEKSEELFGALLQGIGT